MPRKLKWFIGNKTFDQRINNSLLAWIGNRVILPSVIPPEEKSLTFDNSIVTMDSDQLTWDQTLYTPTGNPYLVSIDTDTVDSTSITVDKTEV